MDDDDVTEAQLDFQPYPASTSISAFHDDDVSADVLLGKDSSFPQIADTSLPLKEMSALLEAQVSTSSIQENLIPDGDQHLMGNYPGQSPNLATDLPPHVDEHLKTSEQGKFKGQWSNLFAYNQPVSAVATDTKTHLWRPKRRPKKTTWKRVPVDDSQIKENISSSVDLVNTAHDAAPASTLILPTILEPNESTIIPAPCHNLEPDPSLEYSIPMASSACAPESSSDPVSCAL
ncbi:hypothetical protein Dimus_024616, partial [Dionaea muscipula]